MSRYLVKMGVKESKTSVTKDKGWSWFICISSFFGNLLIGGIKRSFGLALPIMKSYFNANTTAVSWVASILEGMYYVVGPLASVIANVIGLGFTNVTGSILAAIGLLYFCKQNLYALN